MNTIAFLRQFLAYFCFFLASALILSTLAYLMRRQLRMIFDRWRALGKLGQCITLVFVLGFIAYGGTKHQLPRQSANNQTFEDSNIQTLPPDPDMEKYGPLLPTLPSLEGENEPRLVENSSVHAPQDSSLGATLVSQSDTSGLIPISSWTARGAYDDWKRIEFPEGFAFPIGTNAITEITLLANGSLRTSLTNTTLLVSLPYEVSLEPDESSVSYGLSPSNSLLIAWSNACVERSATNRVDATIELFASGDIQTTVYDHSTFNVQHSTFLPAELPEGWSGEGQDSTWAATVFPEFAENIATNGYENWLTDYIGVNEANARYQVKVSIMELPNGPCYLQCGPYKIIVKHPGTYSFPLDYCREYTVRTYPEAVPLTFEYDEGIELDPDWSTGYSAPFRAPRRRAAMVSASGNEYKIRRFPQVFVRPNVIPLEEARNRTIEVFCKASNIATHRYSSLMGRAILLYTNPSMAVIMEAEVQDIVDLIFEIDGEVFSASVGIVESGSSDDQPHLTNEWNEAESSYTNNPAITP